MVDGGGYIHVAFDHHDNKLNYCRSVRPGSLILNEPEPMIGLDEDLVTYPSFYRLPNGDLLFAYRSGSSGRGNLVMNYYSISESEWRRVHDVLIDGEDERSAYWQMYVDGNGTIHLSWVWRETWDVASNHDLCYARSDDGGVTWKRSSGCLIFYPLLLKMLNMLANTSRKPLINQTGMSADRNGNPYISGYWRDEG